MQSVDAGLGAESSCSLVLGFGAELRAGSVLYLHCFGAGSVPNFHLVPVIFGVVDSLLFARPISAWGVTILGFGILCRVCLWLLGFSAMLCCRLSLGCCSLVGERCWWGVWAFGVDVYGADGIGAVGLRC